jgi:cytochrome P450
LRAWWLSVIQKNNRLLLLWASGTRDVDKFEHPDRLTLNRKHPKTHMEFGRGLHFCIGAVLARLEARVVLQ